MLSSNFNNLVKVSGSVKCWVIWVPNNWDLALFDDISSGHFSRKFQVDISPEKVTFQSSNVKVDFL